MSSIKAKIAATMDGCGWFKVLLHESMLFTTQREVQVQNIPLALLWRVMQVAVLILLIYEMVGNYEYLVNMAPPCAQLPDLTAHCRCTKCPLA